VDQKDAPVVSDVEAFQVLSEMSGYLINGRPSPRPKRSRPGWA
jgi:hypothetical protein